MRSVPALLLFLAMLISPVRSNAAESALELLDPATSYTADFVVTSPRGTYQGKVWHAKGRERREVATSGGGQGVLILRGAGLAYVMGLGGRWHVALSVAGLGAMAGGLDAWTVTRTRIAEESVAGIRTTRWSVQATGPRGGFDGEMWTSKDGIVVKAQGVIDTDGGADMPVSMVLSGLKTGAVDPARLEPPQGGLGFDLSKVPPDRIRQAIEGLKPLLEGGRKG